MTSIGKEPDVWTDLASSNARTETANREFRHPKVTTLDGIKPLTVERTGQPSLEQLGPLHSELFGTVDQADVPTDDVVKTYALLDAARVMNLPETLQDSGLRHQCLFKGDAFDNMNSVAPWLVELEAESSFTRNLFTKSDSPWHLWDDEPGIFVRTSVPFDTLYQHFRKFTMLQDDADSTYYFRFWEPDWAVDLLILLDDAQFSAFFANVLKIIVVQENGVCHTIAK
jgi:hypothetical protein